MVSFLKPAVPRKYLFMIAGLIWTSVGILLCWRALGWIENFQKSLEMLLGILGIVLAVAFYFLGFSRIAAKNIRRICALPDKVCLFAFTAWKGYLIIGMMVTAGVLLRNSSFRKDFLAVIYTAMGGALVLASVQFYVWFIRIALGQEPCLPIDQSDSR